MIKKRRVKIHAVIKALKEGARLSHAVRAARVSRSEWYRWEEKHERLYALRKAAEDFKDEDELKEVEAAFVKKLKGGKAHPIEYIFYFTNRDPARWKDKRAVATVVNNNTVDVNNAGQADELAEVKAKQSALLGRLAQYFPN